MSCAIAVLYRVVSLRMCWHQGASQGKMVLSSLYGQHEEERQQEEPLAVAVTVITFSSLLCNALLKFHAQAV